jgi:hypothetical protein
MSGCEMVGALSSPVGGRRRQARLATQCRCVGVSCRRPEDKRSIGTQGVTYWQLLRTVALVPARYRRARDQPQKPAARAQRGRRRLGVSTPVEACPGCVQCAGKPRRSAARGVLLRVQRQGLARVCHLSASAATRSDQPLPLISNRSSGALPAKVGRGGSSADLGISWPPAAVLAPGASRAPGAACRRRSGCHAASRLWLSRCISMQRPGASRAPGLGPTPSVSPAR